MRVLVCGGRDGSMIAICEFCGEERERPCRDLSDMALRQQCGDDTCREALIDRLGRWTVSESGLSMTRTTST